MPEDPAVWRYPNGDPYIDKLHTIDLTDRICPVFMAAYKQAGRPDNSGAVRCLGFQCAWYEKCSKA